MHASMVIRASIESFYIRVTWIIVLRFDAVVKGKPSSL